MKLQNLETAVDIIFHNHGIPGHKDGSEIIYVGQRRPSHDRVAQRLEKAVAIVVREVFFRPHSLRPRARQRVGSEIGSGDFLEAVDAVGVPGDGVNARMAA